MRLPELCASLEAWLTDELAVQRRLAELLEAQERAVLARETAEVTRLARELDAQLACEPQRERRRRAVVDGFARAFGVSASVLTVRSIIERLEAHRAGCEALERLRGELRGAAIDARRRARKLTIVARGHSELLADVLRALAGDDAREPGGAILVDLEA